MGFFISNECGHLIIDPLGKQRRFMIYAIVSGLSFFITDLDPTNQSPKWITSPKCLPWALVFPHTLAYQILAFAKYDDVP